MAAEKTADVPRIRFRTGLPVRSSPDFTDTIGFTTPMARFSLPDDVPHGPHFLALSGQECVPFVPCVCPPVPPRAFMAFRGG